MSFLQRNRKIEETSQTAEQFEKIFCTYFVRLCCFADRYTNNVEESKEIVQEVFLKVWDKRAELSMGDSLEFYLFRSVKNACLNMLRHKCVVNEFQRMLYLLYCREEIDDHISFQSIEVNELEKTIMNAVDNLPKECRRIFLLSREKELRYFEIAEELNISVKTVETQMSRALSRLRLSLRDYL